MKVVEIISDTNIGGAGVLLCNRLKYTDMNKYKTLVLLPKGSNLCQRLKEINVPYFEVDCAGDRSLDIRAVNKYRKIISRFSPDIINAHGCLSARIAAFICRVPVKICTRHCVFDVTKREKAFGILNNLLSDRFISVAHSAKQNLLDMGVRENKISVIINGAVPLTHTSDEYRSELRKKLNIGHNTTVLGFCARLEPCKGHEWFLKCVRLLAAQKFDFKVLLIGDGSQREHLVHLCHKYKISNRVIFCGFVSNVSPLMNIVDININCSVGTETSCLALSEGMSLGIPAVVSDYGGNPYMVKNGQNGLVCRAGDHRQMSRYILLLANDKKLYMKMSQNARARFEHELNAISMTKKTNRLYDELYRHRACNSKL